jgi:hypothetical protein
MLEKKWRKKSHFEDKCVDGKIILKIYLRFGVEDYALG